VTNRFSYSRIPVHPADRGLSRSHPAYIHRLERTLGVFLRRNRSELERLNSYRRHPHSLFRSYRQRPRHLCLPRSRHRPAMAGVGGQVESLLGWQARRIRVRRCLSEKVTLGAVLTAIDPDGQNGERGDVCRTLWAGTSRAGSRSEVKRVLTLPHHPSRWESERSTMREPLLIH
jgi:hypothetical protein